MHSNKTYSVWNDDPNTKQMRRLREFTKLSEGMAENELQSFQFYDIVMKDYPNYDLLSNLNNDDCEIGKKIRVAFKKDRAVCKAKQERYEYLHKKYMPGFWD
jgi:hypothetical protein